MRPLLCVSRADIENELCAAGQDYVTDSTNLVDDVVRNKIRLDILPLMRQINPSVGNSIAKTAMRMEEVARVLVLLSARLPGVQLHIIIKVRQKYHWIYFLQDRLLRMCCFIF